MKRCRTCNRDLPDTAFRIGRKALRPHCRACEADVQRAYRAAHPTYNRDWLRAYRAAHPGEHTANEKRRRLARVLAAVRPALTSGQE
ncbi:MAG: hypothetical protein LC130_03980 [Bryobacterales bacterium]|nr:hypothetical protein [Bryobacterales bacterium]